MKLALPTTKNSVDGHFGHCEYFTVYTVDKEVKKILSEERVAAPKGCGCSSDIASVLAQEGVSLLITNNLGKSALEKLEKEDINVIIGCSGLVEDVATDWLKGTVKRNPLICLDHK